MDANKLAKMTEDEQKGFVYSSTIFWISKSEERIEKLKKQMFLSFDFYLGFLYKSSEELLKYEKRRLKELKEFKTRIENGDFDKIKKETENENTQ